MISTLKKIDVLSTAKMTAIMGIVLGILFGAVYTLSGILSQNYIYAIMLLIGPLAFAIGGFIGGALTALIFNIGAVYVGGIEFEEN